MAPLQSSPVSHSTASEEEPSAPATEDEESVDERGVSGDLLTTPRPGPADPSLRTAANLSTPAIPVPSPNNDPPSTSNVGDSGFDTQIFHHPPTIQVEGAQPRSVSFGASPRRAIDGLPGAAAADSRESRGIHIPRPTSSSKSISFSSGTSLPRPEKQSSYNNFGGRGSVQQEEDMEGEGEGSSSADENTAIATWKKDRTTANYGAAGVEDDQQTQDNMGGANGHEGMNEQHATVRKKKSHVGRGRNSTRGHERHQDQNQQQEDEDEEYDSWWTRLSEKYGSVELENKGSVARDHLALERTFLAWLRTSLSFASIGIAVTQLFRLNTSLANVKDPNKSTSLSLSETSSSSSELLLQQQNDKRDLTLADTHRLRHVGKPLGATFLAIAILILLLGFHRYFESQHYVIRGKFPASRGTILIVSFVATGLICASLAVVLTVAPSTFES